ncbi:hypothetical protein ACWC1C_01280 [Streptomyces sp. NPDC001705]
MVTKPGIGDPNWGPVLNNALDDLQAGVDAAGAATTAVSARVTALEQGNFWATDHGFLAWNYDVNSAALTSALTSGTLYMARLNIRSAITAATLHYTVTTAGSGLTAGQNFVGLYDSAGSRVAVSADQTSAWGSSGFMSTAFTASVPLSVGSYYAAWVCVGTTPITIARSAAVSSGALNAGLTPATFRYSTGGTGLTGLTALPTSITMGDRGFGATSIWCALS